MVNAIEWTGSASQVEELAEVMARIAEPRFKRDFLKACGDEVLKLIRKQFVTEKDPYGKSWTPLSKSTIRRNGPHKILSKSGDMKASIKVIYDNGGTGFKVTSDSPYINFHQFGTRRMVRRMVFPLSGLTTTNQMLISSQGKQYARAKAYNKQVAALIRMGKKFSDSDVRRILKRASTAETLGNQVNETSPNTVQGPLDIEARFDAILQEAVIKIMDKMDIDPFESGGGVAVFERTRRFRDNY